LNQTAGLNHGGLEDSANRQCSGGGGAAITLTATGRRSHYGSHYGSHYAAITAA